MSAPEEAATTSPTLQIHTYHCLCTEFIFASPYSLTSLPVRGAPITDQARILPLVSSSGSTKLIRAPGLAPDPEPIIVRREDGFEKRWLYRCVRCRLLLAYSLRSSAQSWLAKGAAELRQEPGDERAAGLGHDAAQECLFVLEQGLRPTEEAIR